MRSFHLVICFRLQLLHLTSISLPSDDTNSKIKLRLAEEIRNGSITLRELIVRKTFTKLTMQNKNLKTEDFEVSGRTMPLTFIAKNAGRSQKVYETTDQPRVSKHDSRKKLLVH